LILIVDGASTHTCYEFISLCAANNIYVIIGPSHLSMLCNALDNGVNSKFQKTYTQYHQTTITNSRGAPLTQSDYLRDVQLTMQDMKKESWSKWFFFFFL
jgi:hypothetical protein